MEEFSLDGHQRLTVILKVLLVSLIVLFFADVCEAERIYDKNFKLKYYIENGKIYDKKFKLKYRIERGKIYSKKYQLKGYIEKNKFYDRKYKLQGYLSDKYAISKDR